MLHTRPSRLQEQVFAPTAGIICARPPARTFCLASQIQALMSYKTDSGEIQSLVMLRNRRSHLRVQIFARTSGVISVRLPARAFCLYRLTGPSPNKPQNRFFGRSSRLPCFGPVPHVYRCMSLPMQLEYLDAATCSCIFACLTDPSIN